MGVADLFGIISTVVTQFISTLTSGLTALSDIIWDSTATTPHFTFIGIMLLVAVGCGLVMWMFRLIRGVTSGVAK